MFTKHDSRNTQVSNFWLPENSWRPFHWCIIYYCIGVILTKLKWFQHKSKYNLKFNFHLFEKKFKFLGFHAVVLVKTWPLMYQYCRTDIDEARVIFYLGVRTDRRTDSHDFGILIWKQVITKKKKINSKLKIRS